MNTNAISPVDAHLDQVTVKLLTWKPGLMLSVAIAVTHHAMNRGSGQSFYPDEVAISEEIIQQSPNCIGLCYRNLATAGIINATGHFRRSSMDLRKASRGRKVFEYVLASRARAETFLKRNGDRAIPANPQKELAL